MNQKPTAYGYVRVSTEEQATEGVSLEAQEARIRAWAEANGFALVGVFADAGISGKSLDHRPGLEGAVRSAKLERAALIVYSLSRLSRSTTDTLKLADELSKAGADLVSIVERFDTTTAAGKMVFRMMAVLNEFERDLVSERTKAALAFKRKNGKVYGQVPFGFDRAGEDLIENVSQQLTIESIVRQRKANLSFRSIANTLEGDLRLNASGFADWDPSTVRRIYLRAKRDQS